MLSSASTHLCKKISKSPTNKRCKGLGGQGVSVKVVVVCGPSRNSSSTDEAGVTEEGAGRGGILLEGRWLLERSGGSSRLLDSIVVGDAKGAGTEARGSNKEGEELHGMICYIIRSYHYFQRKMNN